MPALKTTRGSLWSPATLKRVLINTYNEWSEVEAPRMGAALAFYTMLSLAPLLLLLTAIAGLIFDPAEVRGSITGQLGALIGKESGDAVETILEQASMRKATGAAASILGFLTLLFGASSVALELRNSLNKIFTARPPEGIAGFLKERSYAVAIVLGAGFLLLVSLAISAALASMSKYMQGRLPLTAGVFEALNFVISLAIFAGVIATIFKFLPTHGPRWREAALGSIATALLFMIGKTLIGIYIGTAAVGSSYGAAGSLVVLLVWVYYSTQILFFGAEFTKVHARDYDPSTATSPEARFPSPMQPQPQHALLQAPPLQPVRHGLLKSLSRLAGSLVGVSVKAKEVFTAR